MTDNYNGTAKDLFTLRGSSMAAEKLTSDVGRCLMTTATMNGTMRYKTR